MKAKVVAQVVFEVEIPYSEGLNHAKAEAARRVIDRYVKLRPGATVDGGKVTIIDIELGDSSVLEDRPRISTWPSTIGSMTTPSNEE